MKNLGKQPTERLMRWFNRYNGEAELVFKTPSEFWEEDMQWYADLLNPIADELERRGTSVEHNWFRRWK